MLSRIGIANDPDAVLRKQFRKQQLGRRSIVAVESPVHDAIGPRSSRARNATYETSSGSDSKPNADHDSRTAVRSVGG